MFSTRFSFEFKYANNYLQYQIFFAPVIEIQREEGIVGHV